MGVKSNLRSSSSEATKPSTPKTNRLLFDKSFDWKSVPYSTDPPHIACGEPDGLLTMDLELKHIPRLGTYKGYFTPLFPKAGEVGV